MSDINVALIAEGPTDSIVIEAALKAILAPRSVILTTLQPKISSGLSTTNELGAGWTGVYRWCRQQVSRGTPLFPGLYHYQIIIIHIDADVAGFNYSSGNITDNPNDDLPCDRPCPPPTDTVDRLRQVLFGWLDTSSTPDKTVLCIPSKCTEAWVAAALYHRNTSSRISMDGLECNLDVARDMARLPARTRLVRIVEGTPKKLASRYRNNAGTMTKQWPVVRDCCTEADRFNLAVIDLLNDNDS